MTQFSTGKGWFAGAGDRKPTLRWYGIDISNAAERLRLQLPRVFPSRFKGSPQFSAPSRGRYSTAIAASNNSFTPSRNALEGPALRSVANPTNKLLRVLLLEDSESDAELIALELERACMNPIIERVDSAESFTTALQNFAPDIVLSDHSSAQFDSRAALEILRAVRPTAAFIVVTGALTGAQSVAAIRAGAEDLVLKDVPPPSARFDHRSARRAASAAQAHRAAGSGTQAGRRRTSDARHRAAAWPEREDG